MLTADAAKVSVVGAVVGGACDSGGAVVGCACDSDGAVLGLLVAGLQ